MAAALWISREKEAAYAVSDCQVVADVAREWRSVGKSDNAAAMQVGGLENPERWTALGEKSRQAEGLVSSPEVQKNLSAWADGFAEFADIARSSTNVPEEVRFKRYVEVVNEVARATDALQAACPDIAAPMK
ncbi:hypothetical protein A5707_11105 [Mycobacterium kyorinense]|uniref:Uncharacterized protein n=1 Tax=Mycobacterium kyorinense TaxID=487514 RepID=A0A1A2ZTA7_9MYCO|nr:hypothetical protein [Mycobacterium kyorinense]OBI53794.1 hypothetical protein A5707_11105 [Mycobacterium kyorinense]